MTDRKNIVNILIVAILAVGLFLGIYLVQRAQIFKPRAAGEQIEFFGDNIVDLSPTKKGFTLDSQGEAKVNLRLTSPFGAAGASPVSSPIGGNQQIK